MLPVLSALLALVASLLRSRLSLSLENVALRYQLAVYKQTVHRIEKAFGPKMEHLLRMQLA